MPRSSVNVSVESPNYATRRNFPIRSEQRVSVIFFFALAGCFNFGLLSVVEELWLFFQTTLNFVSNCVSVNAGSIRSSSSACAFEIPELMYMCVCLGIVICVYSGLYLLYIG